MFWANKVSLSRYYVLFVNFKIKLNLGRGSPIIFLSTFRAPFRVNYNNTYLKSDTFHFDLNHMRLHGSFPFLPVILCSAVCILGKLFGIHPEDNPSASTMKVLRSNLKEGFAL